MSYDPYKHSPFYNPATPNKIGPGPVFKPGGMPLTRFDVMGGSPTALMPGTGGVVGGQGTDRVTMALLLMNALGTGFQAYNQAKQQKEDRAFRQRQYDESAAVRAKGRERLMADPAEHEIQNNDFFNTGTTLDQPPPAGVTPVGPNAARDEELRRILRARMGGTY